MTEQSRGRRSKWLRVALVVGVAFATHALNGSSAQAAPITAPAAKDVVLAGFTSQHFPVFFKVSSNGKAVLVDGIAIGMTCISGNSLVWHDSFGRIPVRAGGKVQAGYASPTILTNGTAYSVTDALTARLTPKHSQLTGTWQLAVNYTFSDGTTDQCTSGPVAFSATN
jgi:hypothetical protein